MFPWITDDDLRFYFWHFDANLECLRRFLLEYGMPESDWNSVLELKKNGEI